MERIYPGSDSVTFAIYGYEEAVAAVTAAPAPAPTPAPAPPSISPLPSGSAVVLTGIPHDQTLVGPFVPGMTLNVVDAATTVGFRFSVQMAVSAPGTISVTEAVGDTQVLAVPAGVTNLLLEFRVLEAGKVAIVNSVMYPL